MATPDLRIARCLVRSVVSGIALVVLTASPAAADPAGPSDFRSVVSGIVPAVAGVHAEIRGGDAFLELHVEPGHVVLVEGYQAEPYLQFLADGTVQRNTRSAATYINDSRKGAGTVPADAQDASAEPQWETVGSGGSYSWHDHRVHWMSDVSPSVARGQRVPGAYDPWKVPIEVDGRSAQIRGTLTYASAISPVPWIAGAIAVAGLLAWFGRRRPSAFAPAALLVGATAAAIVGRADFSSTPGGGNPLVWILPAIALLAGGVAAAPRLRGAATIAALGSVACLSGWALLRLQVLSRPILPTSLPFWVDRATTVAALGICVGVAYLTVSSSQFAFAPLEDDE